MDLTFVWFVLIAILWTGYLVLEGFDFGVAMLMPIVGKNDKGRRVALNTIGPVWDGNEVWVLVAGGAPGPYLAFEERIGKASASLGAAPTSRDDPRHRLGHPRAPRRVARQPHEAALRLVRRRDRLPLGVGRVGPPPGGPRPVAPVVERPGGGVALLHGQGQYSIPYSNLACNYYGFKLSQIRDKTYL